MTAAEIESIVGGYHGDAFRILGPHSIRRKVGQARWEVRAFLPQAETAEVLADGQAWPMEKKHAEGFFCAQMAGEPQRYTLRAHLWDGRDIEIEDPYRFGQLISDTEIYLHGEGTLHEAYRTLGAHLAEADGIRGVRFAVWAPNAENVTVAGEFNEWDIRRHPMRRRNGG
ncbi:MAG TPA: 1,4-alpha-glucan branching enzyme, partial [Bryobacteraceae bacterium]